MKMYDRLRKTLGEPEKQIVPPDSVFENANAETDENLIALWREDGWCSYGKGLFWTVDPADFADLLKDWRAVPKQAVVFARSAFADLFLLNAGEVFFLNVQANVLMPLGPNVYVFLNSTLAQRGLREPFLDGKLFKAVSKLRGELEHNECYGLFPALPLGGGNAEDPKSYQRVKLREYVQSLAQMHK